MTGAILLAFFAIVGCQAQMKYKFYARNLEDSYPDGGPPDATVKGYWWTWGEPQIPETETSIVVGSYNPDFPDDLTLQHYNDNQGLNLWVVAQDYKNGSPRSLMIGTVHPQNCFQSGRNCVAENSYGSGQIYFVPIRNGTELYEVP